MTIMNPQGKPQVEEVLLHFAAERALPTASQLNRYIEAFPEYKAELVDFAASLVNDEFSGESLDSSTCEAAAKRAVSRFHNIRFENERDRIQQSSTKVANPIAPLSRSAFGKLVEVLGLPKRVVAKLRDRKIVFSTIPYGLIEVLAQHLDVSKDLIAAHLVAKPEMARLATSSVVSDELSSQQSFDEALRAEGLSSNDISALIKRFSTDR